MASMASFMLLASFCLFSFITLPLFTKATSSCNGPCETLNDCEGNLICINGKCNDDPDVGSNTCSGGGGSTPPPNNGGGDCHPSGSLKCNGESEPHPQYTCSPPFVPSGTRATLTLNDFSEGGDGGGPSECDETYHPLPEKVVALSTGWFDNRSRCGQMIRITSTKTGRQSVAKVVDECDSVHGCDEEHAGQPPCRNNIVDVSQSVWDELGLDSNDGEASVTWSMA
ncbi:hypothetical protein L6164_026600 [Bauhinia variegata]|uniref:Uncharacterized protein n=1 Tax=Bauhinia variegata TaxID=167791 RepID=A0ACB9LQZ5_BAUVA|nr:hypothetical protein L6164_026600 [Bauhinia variegata]